MSIPVSLTKIINDLASELKEKVDVVVDLTEKLEATEYELTQAKLEVKRLKTALDALTGNDIPIQGTDPSPPEVRPNETPRAGLEPRPTNPAPKVPQGPICKSCGGQVQYIARTLNSGRVVNLWQCVECSNEQF